MHVSEERKVKPWKNSFFRTNSSNLVDEVNRILKNTSLVVYLNDILSYDEGLLLDSVYYKDYSKVEVKYGITSSALDHLVLYFIKEAPVTTAYDYLIIKPNSIDEVAESFLPKSSFPSSFEFVNALNNSLKRPYKKIDNIRPKRIF
ncbi:hypothetical protein JXA48_00470 [Candidatus Woesearchaeota archaeon]|nr:hypothetical protein [Candidatus Woesearchaeota archaeon]